MDDTLCCANTKEALNIEQELTALLGRGGFLLRNFCAGCPSVVETVPPISIEMEVPIEMDLDEAMKSLGLLWNPSSDQFLIIK